MHKGDFEGNWVINPTGGTNEIGGKVIHGNLKEETGSGENNTESAVESEDYVRVNRMNEEAEIVGGDVQIINCMNCEYTLIDPRSVLFQAGMNNEVVIVSDDPTTIEVRKEAGLNNVISYQNHAGEPIVLEGVASKPVKKEKPEIDNRPVLEERTLPMRIGKSITGGNFISGWGVVEGNWYLLVDENDIPIKRGNEFVYQRK